MARTEKVIMTNMCMVFSENRGTYDVEKVLNVASYAHMYVFEFDGKIVGTGSISSFWGSETESILLCIFVLPEFHGKGIGRKIINTLEADEFYARASRIEIPASITATEFYRKFGYVYKNGVSASYVSTKMQCRGEFIKTNSDNLENDFKLSGKEPMCFWNGNIMYSEKDVVTRL